MAAQATNDEFLDLIRKSKVIEPRRLDAYLKRHPRLPSELHKLASQLVQDSLLTNYHAVQILQGKSNFEIGKYKILERLGFGAMSNVYLCVDPETQERVAVKVLTKFKAGDPAALQRFYREARASALLVHPNIVRAHDVSEDAQGHFMVMDFVDGSSIQDIIQHFGPMDVTRCAHYIRQAALGLQFAHEEGLVHRDIKPGNLLIDREGTVKILDMGLARFASEEDVLLTQGVILGAPEYLSPEQALDSHNVDIRADIYSLGATFYFMLTGQPPYAEEKTIAQKLLIKQERPPKPVHVLRPEVPAELEAILDKMMAIKPDDRYEFPEEVAEDLAEWTESPIPPPPAKEMPQLSPAALAETPDDAAAAPEKVVEKRPAKKDRSTEEPERRAKPTSIPAAPRSKAAASAAHRGDDQWRFLDILVIAVLIFLVLILGWFWFSS